MVVRLYRRIGARWGVGEALPFLGLPLQHTQRIDETRACWPEALTIFTELRAPDADDVRAFSNNRARGGALPPRDQESSSMRRR